MAIEHVSEKQFDEIAEAADLERGSTRFYYDAGTSTIIVCANVSPIHESAVQYFTELAAKAKEPLNKVTECKVIMGGASKADLYFETGTKTTSLKGKSPDISLEVVVGGHGSLVHYLMIAVEVGYSKTYNMLKKDVDTWLLGSLGHVRCAILVNLEKPPDDKDFPDINLWGGFIKVYQLAESIASIR
jgi:hypothetical protein